jgi:hypothetical protein
MHIGANHRDVAFPDVHPATENLLQSDFLVLLFVGKIQQHGITVEPFQGIIGGTQALLEMVKGEFNMGADMRTHLHILDDIPDILAALNGMRTRPGGLRHDLVGIECLYREGKFLLSRHHPMAQFNDSS